MQTGNSNFTAAISAAQAVLCFLLVTDVDASCNAAPDALTLFSKTAYARQFPPNHAVDLPHRGLFGRSNRATLVPGVTESIIVGPDLGCSERVIEPGGDAEFPTNEDVVGLVLFGSGSPAPELAVYAIPGVRERFAASLTATAKALDTEIGDGIPVPNWQTDKLEIARERDADGTETYRARLSYPARTSGESPVDGTRGPMSGPTIVALVGATATGVDNSGELLKELLTGGCETIRERFEDDFDGYVCLGRLYDEFASADAGSTARVAPKSTRCPAVLPAPPLGPDCELMSLKSEILDFGEQCLTPFVSASIPPLPKCGQSPTKLQFDVDQCGGLRIPIDWTGILPSASLKAPNVPPAERRVWGRSPVAHEAGPKNDHQILIPGREFLGSVHTKDINGQVGDWRKPDIDVAPPGKDKVVALTGTVDQDESTVIMLPRLKSGHVCDYEDQLTGATSTESCLAVEQMAKGGTEDCACGDKFGWSCTCHTTKPAAYFACTGGMNDGMPCTRPSHCVLGKCDGAPTCQPAGEVWRPGKGHSGLGGGKTCTTDFYCKGTNTTAGTPTPQCGFALFDFSDRTDQNGVVTLNYWLNGFGNLPWITTSNLQRGTCRTDREDECYEGSFYDCWGKSGCAGYFLHTE